MFICLYDTHVCHLSSRITSLVVWRQAPSLASCIVPSARHIIHMQCTFIERIIILTSVAEGWSSIEVGFSLPELSSRASLIGCSFKQTLKHQILHHIITGLSWCSGNGGGGIQRLDVLHSNSIPILNYLTWCYLTWVPSLRCRIFLLSPVHLDLFRMHCVSSTLPRPSCVIHRSHLLSSSHNFCFQIIALGFDYGSWGEKWG